MISQILSLVCSRLQLTNSQSFEMTTLRGFPLSKDRNLGSYGLGALFPRWILKLELPEVRHNLVDCGMAEVPQLH